MNCLSWTNNDRRVSIPINIITPERVFSNSELRADFQEKIVEKFKILFYMPELPKDLLNTCLYEQLSLPKPTNTDVIPRPENVRELGTVDNEIRLGFPFTCKNRYFRKSKYTIRENILEFLRISGKFSNEMEREINGKDRQLENLLRRIDELNVCDEILVDYEPLRKNFFDPLSDLFEQKIKDFNLRTTEGKRGFLSLFLVKPHF